MNKEQRKELARISTELDKYRDVDYVSDLLRERFKSEGSAGFKAEADAIYGVIDGLKDEVDAIRQDEQDKYDNLPESLQGSERGEAIQEAIDTLESADSSLDDALRALRDLDEKGKLIENEEEGEIDDDVQRFAEEIENVIDSLDSLS